MKRKLFLVLGGCGVGKTTALQTVFNEGKRIPWKYLKIYDDGNLRWISDPRLTNPNREFKEINFLRAVDTGKDIVIDLPMNENKIRELLEDHFQVHHIVLTGSDEELIIRHNSRPHRAGNRPKEVTAKIALETTRRFARKYPDNVWDQQKIINFFKDYILAGKS